MKILWLLLLASLVGLAMPQSIQGPSSQTITIPDGQADYNNINTIDTVHWFHVNTQNCSDLNAQVATMKGTTIYPVSQFTNWTFIDINGNNADLDNWTVGLTPSACVLGDNLLLQDLGSHPVADTNYVMTLTALQNVSGIKPIGKVVVS